MAIKVNGTTVINDSRALTNISSVDATTVAAMGAAGVGGATSLITSETTVSNVNSLTITLPTGYKTHIIKLRDFVLSSGWEPMFARFGTSSGIVTSTTYTYAYNGHSSDSSGDRSYMRLGEKVQNSSPSSEQQKYASWTININDASESNSLTYLSFNQAVNKYYDWKTQYGGGHQWNKDVHTKFNIHFENSVSFSGRYEVWGVNV